MRAVIVGGGKVGGELAERLFQRGAGVVVIEADEARARRLSDRVPVLVLVGDGTDMRRLEELELRTTDFFVAVTGVDQDNLASCQLASAAFGVRRVLARMNDPRNREAFRVLGLPTVNVTDEMTAMIERDLELIDRIESTLPPGGDLTTTEFTVGDRFASCLVSELPLPPSTLIVTVSRGDGVLVPHGDTRIQAGDRLTIVTRATDAPDLPSFLGGGATDDEGPG